MHKSAWPIEETLELPVVRTFSNQDGSGSGALEVSVADFDLSPPFFRTVNESWIHDEIPASLRQILKKCTML